MKVFTVCGNRMVRFLHTKGSVLQETYSKSYHNELLLNGILRVVLIDWSFRPSFLMFYHKLRRDPRTLYPLVLRFYPTNPLPVFSRKPRDLDDPSCSPCWKRNHISNGKFSFLVLWGILEIRSKIPENWRVWDNTCIGP